MYFAYQNIIIIVYIMLLQQYYCMKLRPVSFYYTYMTLFILL